jgi:hypothetical protein
LDEVRYGSSKSDFFFIQEQYGPIYGLSGERKIQLFLMDTTSGIFDKLPFSADLFRREGLQGRYNVDSSAFTKAEEELQVPSVRNTPVRSGDEGATYAK